MVSLMDTYKPLDVKYREYYITEKRSLWEYDETNIHNHFLRKCLRTWRKIASKVSYICLYPMVYTCDEQQQIIKQMKERKEFPCEQWRKPEWDSAKVIDVLTIIKEQFLWPNCNFIPEDPLYCIFISPYLWDDIFWVLEDIKDHYHKTIPRETLWEMVEDKKTIEDLFRYIF